MGVLEQAIIFATNRHEGMKRKSSNIPFIIHPLEAVSIAAGITNDPEVLAAVVLHDVVEDTPTTLEEIESVFGKRIAMLVASDNEDKMPDLPPSESWQIRKEMTIEHFETASRDEKIILLSDKLSNIRSINRDYSNKGESLWEIFNQKDKTKQEWYYREVARVTSELSKESAYHEFCKHIVTIFQDETDTDKAADRLVRDIRITVDSANG